MKTNKWEGTFGTIPDAFSETVRMTAARMQRAPRKAVRTRLAMIMAAAVVVLTSTAFALSQLGVLDTLQETLRAFLSPGAEQLVQTDITQTAQQPQHATFTVEEAINDGRSLYAVVRVHGDDDVLLMDGSADASWTTDWWQNGTSAETYSRHADETNRTLVQASLQALDASGNELTPMSQEIHYDGEDILYTLAFPAEGTDATLSLTTFEVFTSDKAYNKRLSAGQLDMSIPITDARSFYAAETPIDLSLGNLTLTLLTVEQTPIATYVTSEYEAAADAPALTHINLLDGIWTEWLDESGVSYPEGTDSKALWATNTGKTRLVSVYRAFDTLPGTITLRFHNGKTGEVFDTITVPLHPTTEEET